MKKHYLTIGLWCLSVSASLLFVSQLVAWVDVGKFQNRDAWVLRNAKIRLTMMQSGGHIGEVVLSGDNPVNPLWIQSRPTIDANIYDAAKNEAFYGGAPGARLMSGLLGHNVCFPFWGNPSPSETKAGMTFHGETGVVRWRRLASGDDFLTVDAQLNESGTTFTRTIRLKGQIAEVEETARNEKAWDRPVGWCEHVTMGAPFLERGVTEIDASLSRGRSDGKAGEFQWPSGFAETRIDLRKVRKLASSPGFVNNFLVDPKREFGFFVAYHPRYHLVFGYVFRRADFPWMNIWESNTPEMFTRGMEFSNTPVHGTFKTLMKTQTLWGTPTFEWLDAKAEMKKRFWIYSLRVPEGFKGVADVQFSDGRVQIVERSTSKKLNVPNS